MNKYITEIRVRYCDIDRMDIVYYGKYFDYIEWARTEFLRSNKLTNKELEEKGIGLPVYSVSGKYKSPSHYDDVLLVETFVKELKGIRITLGYVISKQEDDSIVFEGETTHVVVNLKSMKPTKLPAELENILIEN